MLTPNRKTDHPRRWAMLALSLAVLCTAAEADAGKKQKNKKKKKQEQKSQVEAPAPSESRAPSPEAARIAARLAAYDTTGARKLLDPLGGSDAPDIVIARGRVLEQEKAYDQAAAELRKAADAAPSDPAPWVYLGETYLHAEQQGKADAAFAEAEARAKRAVDAGGGADALYHLGVAQQRLKKFGPAIESLEAARRERPKDAMIVYQLGATRAFQQEWSAAVDLLTEAINMDSGIAYAYYYRGLSAGRMGRKDLLVNDLDRFLQMAPDAPEAVQAKKIRDSA